MQEDSKNELLIYGACGVRGIDAKGGRKVDVKALNFRHFSGYDCFE